MGEQFELKFEKELTPPEKIRKDLLVSAIERATLPSGEIDMFVLDNDFALLRETYTSPKIPEQMVEFFNEYAEEHKLNQRVHLHEFLDKFGHPRYNIEKDLKEAA